MKTCDAIVLSAGSGNRFGAELPKQYFKLNGKEVIVRSLEAIAGSSLVDSIILVVHPDFVNFIIELKERHQLEKLRHVVAGGIERVDSVVNGIAASSADFIAIHDGARPLVRPAKIDEVIQRAFGTGSAILATPANETVKQVQGEHIVATPERKSLWFAKTPQVFDRKLFIEALGNLPEGFIPTDDAQIPELMGIGVSIVQDDPTNIKITYPHDIAIGEALLDYLGDY